MNPFLQNSVNLDKRPQMQTQDLFFSTPGTIIELPSPQPTERQLADWATAATFVFLGVTAIVGSIVNTRLNANQLKNNLELFNTRLKADINVLHGQFRGSLERMDFKLDARLTRIEEKLQDKDEAITYLKVALQETRNTLNKNQKEIDIIKTLMSTITNSLDKMQKSEDEWRKHNKSCSFGESCPIERDHNDNNNIK
jgi:uncharacterized coiled-coil protein SlyX